MLEKFKDATVEVLQSLLPLVVVIIIMQFTVLHVPLDVFLRFLIGSAMAIIGVILFLTGVRTGILPMGKAVGAELPQHQSVPLVIITTLVFGFVVTVTEPGVMVLSNMFSEAGGDGGIAMVFTVAIGMAVLFTVALLRIILGVKIKYILAIVYGVLLTLSLFAPPEFFAIAFDSGSSAAGPFTVPMLLALGLGFVSVLARRSPLSDGFGLIGIACAGPIIGILSWGVFFC